MQLILSTSDVVDIVSATHCDYLHECASVSMCVCVFVCVLTSWGIVLVAVVVL